MCSSSHVQAIAAFERAAAISPEPLSIAYLGVAHARAGHFDNADSLLRQLLSRSEREPVPPRCFVFLYTATGDQERALEWLERAYKVRDSGLFWLRVMPQYDSLRSTTRYKKVLRRLGLPPD
jgi:Flp pilus assembly protein TadD